MNTKILISQAAEAIKMFKIDHDGVCYLIVKNGLVTAVTFSDIPLYHPGSLKIDRFELRRGLTPARVHAIGRELLILYTKGKLCQVYPKP